MIPQQPIKPWLDSKRAALLAKEKFKMTADNVTELVSYDDRNFKVQLARNDPEWERYPHGFVLKVTNWVESQQTDFLESVSRLMTEVSAQVPCQLPVLSKEGRHFVTDHFSIGGPESTFVKECAIRLFTFLPGRTISRRQVNDRMCLTWGGLLGRIHRAIKEPERYPTLLRRYTPWSLWSVAELDGLLDSTISNCEDKALVRSVLASFAKLEPKLRSLPMAVLHGDLNENNVLTSPMGGNENEDDEVYGVLDWGDVHGGARVMDLAVLLTYVLMAPSSLDRSSEENAGLALTGYLQHVPDEAANLPLLKTLVAARLCQSVVKGLEAFQKNPDNKYVLDTQESGWRCLRRLWDTPDEQLLATWSRVIDGPH
uniref:Hydroxylysine kinase n=1 Tax=Rhipicephalus microplus TaxID=6941 RepID=A0A6M2CK70_RHIMP